MLKKTITYKDLDGNPVTEDFYFAFNKAEVVEMELSQKGGLSATVEQLIAAEDGGTIIRMFKDILLSSIGRRGADNKTFEKNEEIRNSFLQSDAYSVLFMELLEDSAGGGNAAANFINGIVPAELAQNVMNGKPIENIPAVKEQPAWITEGRVPTEEELKGATNEQMMEAFRRKAASQQ